jgi:hypothetical protein
MVTDGAVALSSDCGLSVPEAGAASQRRPRESPRSGTNPGVLKFIRKSSVFSGGSAAPPTSWTPAYRSLGPAVLRAKGTKELRSGALSPLSISSAGANQYLIFADASGSRYCYGSDTIPP